MKIKLLMILLLLSSCSVKVSTEQNAGVKVLSSLKHRFANVHKSKWTKTKVKMKSGKYLDVKMKTSDVNFTVQLQEQTSEQICDVCDSGQTFNRTYLNSVDFDFTLIQSMNDKTCVYELTSRGDFVDYSCDPEFTVVREQIGIFSIKGKVEGELTAKPTLKRGVGE